MSIMWKWLLRLSLGLLLLLAVLVGLIRVAIPVIPHYRAQLEQELTHLLQRPVHIDQLDAKLYGLHFNLAMDGVRLPDDNPQQAFHANRLELGFDVLASILYLRPQLDRLIVSGIRLDLRRNAAGDFFIQNNPVQINPNSPLRPLLASLLNKGQLALLDSDVRIRDETVSLEEWSASQVNVSLRNEGRDHHISANLWLPEEVGRSLVIAADLHGDVLNPLHWSGKMYFDAKSLKTTSSLLATYAVSTPFLDGIADVALWFSIEQGRLLETRSRFIASQVQMRPMHVNAETAEPSVQKVIEQLSGELFAHKVGNDIVVQLQNFQLSQGENSEPLTRASLQISRDTALQLLSVKGSLDALQLDMNSPLLGVLDTYLPKLTKPLAELEPQIRATDIGFYYDLNAAVTEPLLYRAHLQNVKMKTKVWIPAVAGLDARLEGGLHRGKVQLLSPAFDLLYPRIFRGAIPTARLAGTLFWAMDQDGFTLASNDLQLSNQDVKTSTRFRYQKAVEGKKGFLDLEAKLVQGDFSKLRTYLPAGVLKENLVRWLDRAVIGGNLLRGDIVFLGDLDAFPFRKNEGLFALGFSADAGLFDYFQGWPRIEELQVDLMIRNQQLFAQGSQGKIFDTDLQNVSLQINDMKKAVIQLRGASKGPLADLVRYSQESPLQKHLSFLHSTQANGEGLMNLSMQLPLGGLHGVVPKIEGDIQFLQNNLVIAQQNIKLDGVQGKLSFTEDAVDGKGLQARLFKKPVVINIASSNSDIGRNTQVDIDGLFAFADFTDVIGSRLPSHLTGESKWHGKILQHSLPGSPDPDLFRVQFSSDLQGVTSTLPDPFAKVSTELLPLEIVSDAGKNGFDVIDVGLGNDANLSLQIENKQGKMAVARGQLAYGNFKAKIPQGDFLEVVGQVDHLDVMTWFNRNPKTLDETSSALDDTSSSLGIPLIVNVNIESVAIFGQKIERLMLRAKKQDNAWLASLDSEKVKGTLHFFSDKVQGGTSLAMDFDYLRLSNPWVENMGKAKEMEVAPKTVEEPPKKNPFNPGSLPSISLKSKDFYYGNLALGSLDFSGGPGDLVFHITSFVTHSKSTDLVASGDWRSENQFHTTDLHMNVKSTNIKSLFEGLGFKQGIVSSRALVDLEGSWPGTPMDFTLANVEGLLYIKLNNGQLLDIDPGAGRVVGLFSTQTLTRRLKLDFSDLYSKGLGFDKAEGNFNLMEGDAYTTNLRVDSPAAVIELSGRTGLRNRDYDQIVAVTSEASSTLPILGGVVGGPGMGAAIYLAERLLKKNIDNFTRTEYRIKGPWSQPKIERVNQQKVVKPQSAVPITPPVAPPITPPITVNPQGQP